METAFKFYEKCLGGKITTMMTRRITRVIMTDQVTPEWRNKIMHISLMIGDQELMGSDSPPEYCEEPKAFPCRLA